MSITGSSSEHSEDGEGGEVKASDATKIEVKDLLFVGRSEEEATGTDSGRIGRTGSFLPLEAN